MAIDDQYDIDLLSTETHLQKDIVRVFLQTKSRLTDEPIQRVLEMLESSLRTREKTSELFFHGLFLSRRDYRIKQVQESTDRAFACHVIIGLPEGSEYVALKHTLVKLIADRYYRKRVL